ncbi:MAG: transglycosylase SLT domain-containing protein [Candidatus Pacearchaeota archaeon]|jgi:hypothetical protein
MVKFKDILGYLGGTIGILLILGVGGIIGDKVFFRNSVDKVDIPVYKNMDVIEMTEEEFYQIKEKEIMQMLIDTAKVYSIKTAVFCGLAYHESERFKYAHRKIMDRNNRWSYGLFMIQMETAKLYDKSVTEAKLMTPRYNTHLAAVIFQKNLEKYDTNEYAIAAHNAGTISNHKINNPEFVKKVYTAIGEVVAKYNF